MFEDSIDSTSNIHWSRMRTIRIFKISQFGQFSKSHSLTKFGNEGGDHAISHCLQQTFPSPSDALL